MNEPPFTRPVTPKELAHWLGRSAAWVRARCASGEIRTHPIGPPYFIPADEANRLLCLFHDDEKNRR